MTTRAKESTAATLTLDQRVSRGGRRSLYRRGDGGADLRLGQAAAPLRRTCARPCRRSKPAGVVDTCAHSRSACLATERATYGDAGTAAPPDGRLCHAEQSIRAAVSRADGHRDQGGDAGQDRRHACWCAPTCAPAGSVCHGGAFMAFADTIGAIGTVMNLPPNTRTTTIESKTNFLGAAPSTRASPPNRRRCTAARPRRCGRP